MDGIGSAAGLYTEQILRHQQTGNNQKRRPKRVLINHIDLRNHPTVYYAIRRAEILAIADVFEWFPIGLGLGNRILLR